MILYICTDVAVKKCLADILFCRVRQSSKVVHRVALKTQSLILGLPHRDPNSARVTTLDVEPLYVRRHAFLSGRSVVAIHRDQNSARVTTLEVEPL